MSRVSMLFISMEEESLKFRATSLPKDFTGGLINNDKLSVLNGNVLTVFVNFLRHFCLAPWQIVDLQDSTYNNDPMK